MRSSNIYLFFISMLTAVFLVQCKTINEDDVRKHQTPIQDSTEEPFKDFYPSGKLKIEGQYIDNKKTGKWVSYYENGEERAIKNYLKGELNGYQKMDYSQVLYMEGNSKDGVKVGTWKSYFKENKQLKYVKHFDDKGNATGEWKTYYETGELYLIENYLNNRPHGKQVEYFKNGNISSVGKNLDGQKEGLWNYYYEDGTLRSERAFKNGVANGKYIDYFKNGKVYTIGNKENFKKVGVWKTFNKEGGLIETVTY
ncbi:toxin-antitoxin system YwqK family antitoxin [Aequorivita marina]|uniref:toxin-antitoxin system YwqK family antitoxin n=1 Tax=Aequorivita marina TaxID=3073654 RepID=UPI0028764D18|nr:toxin-antitoxin system YwqK family antitoxin [Aequorivita sp. S2608]MDS1298601.1 toxin-antitoxin system YwqK family antitoxin [Aequorivita sp. S2608]